MSRASPHTSYRKNRIQGRSAPADSLHSCSSHVTWPALQIAFWSLSVVLPFLSLCRAIPARLVCVNGRRRISAKTARDFLAAEHQDASFIRIFFTDFLATILKCRLNCVPAIFKSAVVHIAQFFQRACHAVDIPIFVAVSCNNFAFRHFFHHSISEFVLSCITYAMARKIG